VVADVLQKAEGVVIRTMDYGETNKIINIYTRESGKIGLMARGAKKTKSRLSAVSQLFTYGHYLFFKGSGLGTLRQGEIIESFRALRSDLFRTSYTAVVIELLDKVTEEGKPDPFLFEIVYQTLHYIDEGIDAEVLMMIFEVKMLPVIGIRPKLDECVNCGRNERPFAFSAVEGGLLCLRCLHVDERHRKLSDRAVYLLRLFTGVDLHRLGKVSLKPETKRELKTVISEYYDEYSGVRLKSKRFLDQLETFQDDNS
jgi:DNA repair protein RecO (recombination protein O)